jgi:hypothetical protein
MLPSSCTSIFGKLKSFWKASFKPKLAAIEDVRILEGIMAIEENVIKSLTDTTPSPYWLKRNWHVVHRTAV